MEGHIDETEAVAFGELSAFDAIELLRTHRFGRLAFAHESWPVVLPVNYGFEDPALVIRTAPGAKLDSSPFHAAAFEIDDVDPNGTWGWSVLVQGPAFEITDALDERSTHLRELVVRPQAPGAHEHWLMISATRVSGRYFGAHPLSTRNSHDG